MTEFNILSLSLVISVTGLCAFGFVVVFCLRGKKQQGFPSGNGVVTKLSKRAPRAEDDLVERLVRVEKSFGMMAQTIHSQRKILRDLIQKSQTAALPKWRPVENTQWAVDYPRGREDRCNGNSGFDRQYDLVSRLAASGLTVDEIAGQVKVPRAEIELILKFRSVRRHAENEKSGQIRAVS